MKYAAININFDSLGEAYGFPTDYHDPSFFEVAERFMSLAQKYNFKYSIYIIGKDLEKPENQAVVKAWAEEGHEIGNHSWSHPLNLGSLPLEQLHQEVLLSHQIITETTGISPKGFIAPGWSTSEELLRVLLALGYEYDTSTFPSWFMYMSLVKMLYNTLGTSHFRNILQRQDLLSYLVVPRYVYHTQGSLLKRPLDPRQKSLAIMPMPTNRYRIVCWHTLGFIFGWKFQQQVLRQSLRELDAFYYLIHPADLTIPQDTLPNKKLYWERLEAPLSQKMAALEQAIEIMLESGREIVTMRELLAKTTPNPWPL